MQERLYGLKKFLCFEFAACFLLPTSRAKKRGKFKIKKFFQSIESFLYCLSSSVKLIISYDGFVPSKHLFDKKFLEKRPFRMCQEQIYAQLHVGFGKIVSSMEKQRNGTVVRCFKRILFCSI